MDEIAGATKVIKRTLYYHFESEDALLTAVLEAQHQLAVDGMNRLCPSVNRAAVTSQHATAYDQRSIRIAVGGDMTFCHPRQMADRAHAW